MSILHELGTILLRKLPAENAHKLTIKALGKGLGPKSNTSTPSGLEVNVGGLSLPNPVGLAAGFDKDCEVSTPMLAAGFGFANPGFHCWQVLKKYQAQSFWKKIHRKPF